jgi:hypothetical protein
MAQVVKHLPSKDKALSSIPKYCPTPPENWKNWTYETFASGNVK